MTNTIHLVTLFVSDPSVFYFFIHKIGGFECSCNSGYNGDGFTCADSDECASSPCDSNATCENTDGGFTCACNSGFSGDGFSCSDDDECASNPCDVNASCENLSGLGLNAQKP